MCDEGENTLRSPEGMSGSVRGCRSREGIQVISREEGLKKVLKENKRVLEGNKRSREDIAVQSIGAN